MSTTDDLPPTAHTRTEINCAPEIFELRSGRYAIEFGDGLSLHVSREQWYQIDSAVRQGIGAQLDDPA
jgi:hypothetical protein